jgi:diguanylate cyclase (GGDEF)-like protein
MKACVRESDTVARMGGDEFTVLLADLNDRSNVERVAQALVEAMRQPFTLDGREARIGVSIGIGLYPDHGADADPLVSAADSAMYLAKEGGKSGFRFAPAGPPG